MFPLQKECVPSATRGSPTVNQVLSVSTATKKDKNPPPPSSHRSLRLQCSLPLKRDHKSLLKALSVLAVLTAGHCCVDPNRNAWPPDGFRILLGAYSIDGGGTLDSYAEPQTGGAVTSVSAVHIPPGYKTQDFWDVCVLTLTHADAKVKPAVLGEAFAAAV